LKKSLKKNRVSISEDGQPDNEGIATICDLEVPLVLDTGVQITVLLEEVVPAASETGHKVWVKGYVGDSELRDLAIVKMKIGGHVWNETVALVSSAELNGKGLLAVRLDMEELWELLDLLRKNELKVQALETRA